MQENIVKAFTKEIILSILGIIVVYIALNYCKYSKVTYCAFC